MKKLIILGLLLAAASPISAGNYCDTVKGSYLQTTNTKHCPEYQCECENNLLKCNYPPIDIVLTKANMVIKLAKGKLAKATAKDNILKSKNLCNKVHGSFWDPTGTKIGDCKCGLTKSGYVLSCMDFGTSKEGAFIPKQVHLTKENTNRPLTAEDFEELKEK